jgi:hypothetical protein
MVDPFLVGRIRTLALGETRIKFEYNDEFCNLLRVQKIGLRMAKQQKKLRDLLNLLDRVTSPFESRRGHDRPMIRQQHRAVRRRVSANGGAKRGIRPIVGSRAPETSDRRQFGEESASPLTIR